MVFVIFKLQFRIICSCSNYLKYMENLDYRSILIDSGTIVQWRVPALVYIGKLTHEVRNRGHIEKSSKQAR